MGAAGVDKWLYPTDRGLYCEPGDFFIDPARAVDRAVITHGHSDHARPGHGAVLATHETIEIMKVRMGPECAGAFEPLAAGRSSARSAASSVRLAPAGHILGAAQVVLEWNGQRAVVSGDYKRAADPTCPPFELVACDVFVTEATFALPVFRHEPAEAEVGRLLASHRAASRSARISSASTASARRQRVDQARPPGRLRRADLPARRARRAVRALSAARCRSRRRYARRRLTSRDELRRRARALPALRGRRPLVAPLPRSRHRLRLGMDAHQGPHPPVGRRTAARHLRSRRLAGAARHHRRDRRRGRVGDARARRRARLPARPDGPQSARACRSSASRTRAE